MIKVLAYNAPHRKTQDVLFRLKALGYQVKVYGRDFAYEKKFTPLISHRPSSAIYVNTETLCERLGFEYVNGEPDVTGELFLISGWGMVDAQLALENQVINSHPGILPYVRGLDAYKWALHYNLPIGVTTHAVDGETDGGWLINQVYLEPEGTDTFHSLALRLYELEIEMLIDAIDKPVGEQISLENTEARKRMPHLLETQLFDRFQNRKMAQKG